MITCYNLKKQERVQHRCLSSLHLHHQSGHHLRLVCDALIRRSRKNNLVFNRLSYVGQAVFYGAVPKWFKGPDLKSVRQGNLCVRSNRTSAAILIEFFGITSIVDDSN